MGAELLLVDRHNGGNEKHSGRQSQFCRSTSQQDTSQCIIVFLEVCTYFKHFPVFLQFFPDY
jgi:hypothetical protein